MCSRTFGPASVPSFVMCPIRKTGIPVILEYLRRLAEHSLT